MHLSDQIPGSVGRQCFCRSARGCSALLTSHVLNSHTPIHRVPQKAKPEIKGCEPEQRQRSRSGVVSQSKGKGQDQRPQANQEKPKVRGMRVAWSGRAASSTPGSPTRSRAGAHWMQCCASNRQTACALTMALGASSTLAKEYILGTISLLWKAETNGCMVERWRVRAIQ